MVKGKNRGKAKNPNIEWQLCHWTAGQPFISLFIWNVEDVYMTCHIICGKYVCKCHVKFM